MRKEFSLKWRSKIKELIIGLTSLALIILFAGSSRLLTFWGLVIIVIYAIWAITVFNEKVILDDKFMIIDIGVIKTKIYYSKIIRLYLYKDRVLIMNDKKDFDIDNDFEKYNELISEIKKKVEDDKIIKKY